MKKIVLIGGGGHCKSCIDVIEAAGTHKIIGILDSSDKVGQMVCGHSIIGTDDKIEELAALGYAFHITVGHMRSPEVREKIFRRLKAINADLPVLVSPRARVSPHADIG